MFWHVKAYVFERVKHDVKRVVSMVYKNWQTNKASVMKRI